MRILSATLVVWIILFAVPVVVYGLYSAVTGLAPPGDAPWLFLTGVAVSKLGTALMFVLLFGLAEVHLKGQWLLYALIWWLMFAFGEVGQAIGPGYSWQEAVPGVVSEAIYLPLSSLVLNRMMRLV
jgi:hypothetical protein